MSCRENQIFHDVVKRWSDAVHRHPHLVEDDGGALPRDTILPVVVGGVHGSATEHAGHGARGIGAIIGDATPGGRGANVAGVVMSQEGLDAHKLHKQQQRQRTFNNIFFHNHGHTPPEYGHTVPPGHEIYRIESRTLAQERQPD